MFLPIKELIILGIGCFFLAIWLLIFLASKKYDSMFAGLNEKEYPLKEIYSTGYAVMMLAHYNFKSKWDRKCRQELEILYEKRYVEYYLRVTYAQAITYGMMLFVASFIAYGLTGEIVIFLVMIFLSGVAVYYYLTLPAEKIKKRSKELMSDFCEVISKLALLTNAGMILREAWETVANAGEGLLYEEMKSSVEEMQNGISEMEAIRRFGNRCMLPEIKKFCSTLIQGIQKGNKELALMLQQQSSEIWEIRKQNVRREGEKAAGKLMIPIFIMFGGIMLMVIVPIFTNIGI